MACWLSWYGRYRGTLTFELFGWNDARMHEREVGSEYKTLKALNCLLSRLMDKRCSPRKRLLLLYAKPTMTSSQSSPSNLHRNEEQVQNILVKHSSNISQGQDSPIIRFRGCSSCKWFAQEAQIYYWVRFHVKWRGCILSMQNTIHNCHQFYRGRIPSSSHRCKTSQISTCYHGWARIQATRAINK